MRGIRDWILAVQFGASRKVTGRIWEVSKPFLLNRFWPYSFLLNIGVGVLVDQKSVGPNPDK